MSNGMSIFIMRSGRRVPALSEPHKDIIPVTIRE